MKYLIITIFLFAFPTSVFASRGCCSWHGGISYCGKNGYYICNDGTQSPSCKCSSVSGSIGTSDSSCNYGYYQNQIDLLNDKLSGRDGQIKTLEQEIQSKDGLIAILLIIIIGYIIYRIMKADKHIN